MAPTTRQARRRSAPSAAAFTVADRLHSAAIHLLRRVRAADDAMPLTPPQASAMSVIVFAGPLTAGQLAAAERVRPPTISRLLAELERQGLVARVPDPEDERSQRITATARGRRLLQDGRRRRVERLAADLAALAPAEQRLLGNAADLLERLLLPAAHPLQQERARR